MLFANFFMALVIAFWVGAIALLAVQNVTPVTLKFLGFESIPLAIGLLLGFSLGLGLILGSLLPMLWQRNGKRRATVETFDEFDFEEE